MEYGNALGYQVRTTKEGKDTSEDKISRLILKHKDEKKLPLRNKKKFKFEERTIY